MTRTSSEPHGDALDAIGGVRDYRRLDAVAQAELAGHMGDPALNAIVATLRIACRVPIAVVNVVAENLQTYPAEVGVGAPCTTVPDDLSFCAEVVESRAPVMVVDAATHPTYARNPLVRDGVVGAYAGFPLIDDGFVLGSVSVFDSEPRVFTMEELALIAHQARLASAVLALRRTARTDPLTGLPNRRSLLDRLGVAVARIGRHGGHLAVMHLGVDGLPALTDARGREARDEVLLRFAHGWRAVLRPTDTLARVGAGEFVAVCGELTTDDQAAGIADRLVEVGSGTIAASQPSDLRVSIGVVLAGDARTEPDALLLSAEAGMRRATATAGSGWALTQ